MAEKGAGKRRHFALELSLRGGTKNLKNSEEAQITTTPNPMIASVNLSIRGCVNLASRLPLAASAIFTQPLNDKYALQ